MMRGLRILIASGSLDHHTFDPVVKELTAQGHEVITYMPDKVVDGTVDSSLYVANDGVITLRYGDSLITDATIDAAWFRRPSLFGYERSDKAVQMSLEESARSAFSMAWDCIDAAKWLNSPDDILRAQRKIWQFSMAHAVGMKLPGAIMTNSWDVVRSIGEKSVMKVTGRGFLQGNDDTKLLFTTPLDDTKIQSISHTNPFPGLFEPYIPKKREWRVTVVGSRIFPVAIYTSNVAKDDWRRHQGTTEVDFHVEELPDSTLAEKCKNLLERCNLRFGAFDFIETPDGEMIFLEVNPNGQYGWLEKTLGLPISKAVADELIQIGLQS
ncbi:hypothetical protein PV379_05095 [Streptomyces caniscabiei]|uniref:hypothetical protein n=1 Tax=Streptomyces caniscabiei TaxID=2746961 RepID=UPI0029ACF9D6|nr:hypothetical protein [Streptomyces caniscabiei]MDX2776707.1 hypothetical protein [Streptomyces caniscabiei]